MNWSLIGKLAINLIGPVMSAIEHTHGGQGKDAKIAALTEGLRAGLTGVSSATGKDILADPKVAEALRVAASALSTLQNVIAAVDRP